MAMLEKMKEFV
jgi:hypothetical protein